MSSQRRAFVVAALAWLLGPRLVAAQPATRVARIAFLASGPRSSWADSVEIGPGANAGPADPALHEV